MNRWPIFLITLILAFIAFTWWSLDRAASEVSPVTDPDYYNHGLRYNHTQHERRGQEAREWAISQELSGRRLTIRVADGHQQGILGCQGSITFAAGGADQEATPPLKLTEAGVGLYTAEIPDSQTKALPATLTLRKGEATLEQKLIIALAP